MIKFFNKQKEEPENIEEILVGFKNLKERFDEVSKELKDIKAKSNFFMQKVGMIRFNPFKEVGGDQSFSLAILDGSDSGVVITSYYSRKENRIYGKPIKNGSSDYPLSEEEVLAIEKAKNFNFLISTEDKPKNSGKKIKKDNGK
jgi:hypothetical protein